MILLDTKFHQAIENTDLYKAIYAQVKDTIKQHTCAQDEQQSYDEKEDGLYVGGIEECAMFLSAFIYQNMKAAWEDGFRVRTQACGNSHAVIVDKKREGYSAFKSALINDLNKMEIWEGAED